MIDNFVPCHMEDIAIHRLVFDDGMNNGFSFPCNEHGSLLPGVADCARENYEFCMANQNSFVRSNEVVSFNQRVVVAATGTCHCGNNMELHDEYYGACRCGKCGQWYNMFGQELLPPDEWEEEWEEDE